MTRISRWISAVVLLASCQRGEVNAGRDPKRAAPVEPSFASAQEALFAAEQRRDSSAVSAEALSNHDVQSRRLAARTLARIADARSAELLRLSLADEDREVSTWSAYGLGYACQGREANTVHALVARAASSTDDAPNPRLWSPIEAISDALGRCATAEAESTLRAWLRGPKPRAAAAALALGRVAARTGKLADETLVALLDSSDGATEPLPSALFPLTRLAALNGSTAERAENVALRLIRNHAPSAEFAVRALAHTGPGGVTALGQIAGSAESGPNLRAQAVRELANLGTPGQAALWAAFDVAPKEPPGDAALEQEDYAPLSALLDALKLPLLGSVPRLRALAELELSEHDSTVLHRRKVRVRCNAAALLAGTHFQDPILRACDPADESPTRDVAVLRVIEREPLRGARKRAFLERTRATNPLVRDAAIGQLSAHNELREASQVLTDALGAKELGIVASAALVLASYPERATRMTEADPALTRAANPDPNLVKALGQAYVAAGTRNNVEVQGLLLDSIGALQVLSLKNAASDACRSDNPSLREHAQKALRLLGEQNRHCDEFKPSEGSKPTPTHELPRTLTLETEVGPLTLELDSRFAPNAVARVIQLAEAGFYDAMAIHRVVPGFVVQFGDRVGDGYGGDDQPPLRCETSPISFLRGAVGVALSGRDTGSSQLFVTLGRYPHLDGEYAWIGQAGPGWDRVAVGDRILHARVGSAP